MACHDFGGEQADQALGQGNAIAGIGEPERMTGLKLLLQGSQRRQAELDSLVRPEGGIPERDAVERA